MIPNYYKWGQKTFENADADKHILTTLTYSTILAAYDCGFQRLIYWEEIDDYKEEEDEYEPEGCSKTDNGENTIEQRRQK